MPLFARSPLRAKEKGQTLVLVAICLFVLIAMAALAIDLTTLYVARGQMQRAADAAALAGAKAFVDSGVTTSNNTDPNYANLQGLASNMGTQIITALLAQNKVGGAAPVLVGTPTFDFTTHPGNPQVTVTLQRTDVPTFFARIFGRRLVTVQATAVAEAYNSSLPPGGAGNQPPVAPSCIKPWMIPNVDPQHGNVPFVSTAGAIVKPGIYPSGVIGEAITLVGDCTAVGPVCVPISLPPNPMSPAAGQLYYLPSQLAAATGSCPSCAGGTDFEQSSACCDTGNSSQYACGTSQPGVIINLATNLLTETASSVECLIGATSYGPAAGQDEIGLGVGAQPPADTFGNFLASNGNDPIEIRAGGPPHSGQLVTTSPSIVTLPIYDNTIGLPLIGQLLGPAKIIGFMQAFVEQSNATGNVQIYVLNISGCGTNVNTALTPVSGGGVSAVPVRLIHN